MPPRALTALLLLCVLAAASPLVTMAADDPRIAAVTAAERARSEASVRAAHLARFDSVVSNDLPRLEALLADDLDYCHSNGVCESKREYIGSLRSGQMKYQSIDPTIQSVKMLDDVALLLGHANVKATRDGVERSIRIGYTCVFALRDGRWQLTSWRSITLPDTQAG